MQKRITRVRKEWFFITHISIKNKTPTTRRVKLTRRIMGVWQNNFISSRKYEPVIVQSPLSENQRWKKSMAC
jgi:hypothetical protein